MKFTDWKHWAGGACAFVAAGSVGMAHSDPANSAVWNAVAQGALFVAVGFFGYAPSVKS